MLRNHRFRVFLLALLCIAVLVGRVGGAHLHLCLDGSEAFGDLHLFELGQHHDQAHSDQPHNDVDVVLLDDLIAKSKSQWQLPVALLAAAVLFGLLRMPRGLLVSWVSRPILPPPPLFLRPPLCGPPC